MLFYLYKSIIIHLIFMLNELKITKDFTLIFYCCYFRIFFYFSKPNLNVTKIVTYEYC